MVAGSILPVSFNDKNQLCFLFGKENPMEDSAKGFSDFEILLKFDCLIKTKTPKFEQYYSIRTDTDETRMVRKAQAVWRGIKQGVFVPNDTSWKCNNCFYKKPCDDWLEGRIS